MNSETALGLEHNKVVASKSQLTDAKPLSLSSKASSGAGAVFKKKNRKKKSMPRIVVRGQWTPEEDERLRRLVGNYGAQRWTELAQHFDGRRVGKQCRERWHNHLNPELRTADWMPAEEACVYAGWKYYGPQWAKIANHLRGRSDNRVKNHWNCHVKKFLNRVSEKFDPDYEVRLQQIAEHFNFNRYFTVGEQIPAHMLGVSSSSSPSPTFSEQQHESAPTMATVAGNEVYDRNNTELHARRKAGSTTVSIPCSSGSRQLVLASPMTPNAGAGRRGEILVEYDEAGRRSTSSAAGIMLNGCSGSVDKFDTFATPTKIAGSSKASGLAVMRSSTAQRRLIPPTRLPTDSSASLQQQQKNQTPDMYEKYNRLQLRPGNYTFSPAEALQSPPKKRAVKGETPYHLPVLGSAAVTSGFSVTFPPPPHSAATSHSAATFTVATNTTKTLAALDASKRQLFFELPQQQQLKTAASATVDDDAANSKYIQEFLNDVNLEHHVDERELHADIALAMALVNDSNENDGIFNTSAGSGSSGADNGTCSAGQQQREALFATPLPKLAGVGDFPFYHQSCTASPPPTISTTQAKTECPTPDIYRRPLLTSKLPATAIPPEPAYPPYVMQTPLYNDSQQHHQFSSSYNSIFLSQPFSSCSQNYNANVRDNSSSSGGNAFSTSTFLSFSTNNKHNDIPTTPEKLQESLALSSLYYHNNTNNNQQSQQQQSSAWAFGFSDDDGTASPSFDDFMQSAGGVSGNYGSPDKAQLWAAVELAARTGLTPVKFAADFSRKRSNNALEVEATGGHGSQKAGIANVVKKLKFGASDAAV